MNTLFSLLLALTALPFIATHSAATTVGEQLDSIAARAATLNLGFDGYILGQPLTAHQQDTARNHPIEKTLAGTYKFKDGDLFVIAVKENDVVLGMYKEYKNVSFDTIKSVIGGLMLTYGEPTATAHDKLIYWTYNEKGKIPRDVFDFSKGSGDLPLAAVKFASSEMVEAAAETSAQKEETPLSAYVMITSDPLSKLFLAQSRKETK